MSGGHWGYISNKIEESFDHAVKLGKALSWIEYKMDWATSGDTCRACAQSAAFFWLEIIFDMFAGELDGDIIERLALVSHDHRCARCTQREPNVTARPDIGAT